MIPEAFTKAAFEAGCPEDQAIHFLRARIALQPRQLQASAAARQREISARLDHGRDAFTYLVGAERPIHALAERFSLRSSR